MTQESYIDAKKHTKDFKVIDSGVGLLNTTARNIHIVLQEFICRYRSKEPDAKKIRR